MSAEPKKKEEAPADSLKALKVSSFWKPPAYCISRQRPNDGVEVAPIEKPNQWQELMTGPKLTKIHEFSGHIPRRLGLTYSLKSPFVLNDVLIDSHFPEIITTVILLRSNLNSLVYREPGSNRRGVPAFPEPWFFALDPMSEQPIYDTSDIKTRKQIALETKYYACSLFDQQLSHLSYDKTIASMPETSRDRISQFTSGFSLLSYQCLAKCDAAILVEALESIMSYLLLCKLNGPYALVQIYLMDKDFQKLLQADKSHEEMQNIAKIMVRLQDSVPEKADYRTLANCKHIAASIPIAASALLRVDSCLTILNTMHCSLISRLTCSNLIRYSNDDRGTRIYKPFQSRDGDQHEEAKQGDSEQKPLDKKKPKEKKQDGSEKGDKEKDQKKKKEKEKPRPNNLQAGIDSLNSKFEDFMNFMMKNK